MNLIEAIKSGKPFRRKSEHNIYSWLNFNNLGYLHGNGCLTSISGKDEFLADYEIQEKIIEITESQFDEAVNKIIHECSDAGRNDLFRYLKGELGF